MKIGTESKLSHKILESLQTDNCQFRLTGGGGYSTVHIGSVLFHDLMEEQPS